jgi:hypothetical protein
MSETMYQFPRCDDSNESKLIPTKTEGVSSVQVQLCNRQEAGRLAGETCFCKEWHSPGNTSDLRTAKADTSDAVTMPSSLIDMLFFIDSMLKHSQYTVDIIHLFLC